MNLVTTTGKVRSKAENTPKIGLVIPSLLKMADILFCFVLPVLGVNRLPASLAPSLGYMSQK